MIILMSLDGGRLYDVHGARIYGAGSTSVKSIESWNQIMYVQDEKVYQDGVDKSHVYLADGNQHSNFGIGILIRVKVPFRRFTLIENQVLSDKILGKTTICRSPGEHLESVDKFLRKAEEFADRLPHGEKRDRYLTMIRDSLYEKYSEKI